MNHQSLSTFTLPRFDQGDKEPQTQSAGQYEHVMLHVRGFEVAPVVGDEGQPYTIILLHKHNCAGEELPFASKPLSYS